MWSRGFRLQLVRQASTVRKVGVLFDVDGVLLRGGSVIPAARRALRKLMDQNQNFLFPVVFVTNAGSCLRHHKAQQLSHLLDVQIAPEQVVLSHSPLHLMETFHDKCVLVSGQGPVTQIAHSLGFQKVVTVEELSEQHPLLDMVDHSRRPTSTPSSSRILPQMQAIILFGEPIRWETNLQLIIDVLLTNGRPGCVYDTQLSAQMPVLACNMDLLWMAEAPSPRFGHGMFLLCLESIYRKLTGRRLEYEAVLGKPSLLTYQYAEQLLRQQNQNHKLSTIYAHHADMMSDTKLVAQGTGNPVPVVEEVAFAAQCRSILVCTGVYNPHSPLPGDQNVSEAMVHGQNDPKVEPDLVEPSHMVEDVEAAVDLMLQQESSNT
ncbi:hypothetical protein CCH79_00019186 [Gambusia affinis]|uniref:Haloacid dehalogenase-like hydrolase domain-containing 5 n=1 Tax=Gambusia affinis TaxID=33528 RepID=A0A315UQC1_GAMAF|nr:hypothetical protein CCH79_00019186 [Gambusia affinis]